jgi:hypothetical protein
MLIPLAICIISTPIIRYRNLGDLQKMLDTANTNTSEEGIDPTLQSLCSSSQGKIENGVYRTNGALTTPKIFIPDEHGNTVVMLAARQGNTKAFKCIRQYSVYYSNDHDSVNQARTVKPFAAHCNVQNDFKKTALTYAAESDHLDMFKLLIESGATLDDNSEKAFREMIARKLDGNSNNDELKKAFIIDETVKIEGESYDVPEHETITATLTATLNKIIDEKKEAIDAGAAAAAGAAAGAAVATPTQNRSTEPEHGSQNRSTEPQHRAP